MNVALESFNARFLSPTEVARTFVHLRAYDELLDLSNAIIVGPRGSGKTTLLKMLTPEALGSWRGHNAGIVRETIPFLGVFVPADRTYGGQLTAKDMKSKSGAFDSSACCAYTIHVLCQFFGALKSKFALDTTKEAELSNAIAADWQVKLAIPSFLCLRRVLRQLIRSVFHDSGESRNQIRAVANESTTSAILRVVDIVEEILSFQSGMRVALLCDELEVLPKSVVADLLGMLRSHDSRIIFKLCASPYMPRFDEFVRDAQEGGDYKTIKLWHAKRAEASKFARALLAKVYPPSVCGGRELEDVLGESTPPLRSSRKWLQHQQSAFQSLAGKDPSFAEYLRVAKVPVGTTKKLSEDERASKIGKVASIVFLRDTYMSPRESNRKRSVKVEPYAGFDSLVAITEGNPRHVKNLFAPLAKMAAHSTAITPGMQLQEVKKLVGRLRSMLSTMPFTVGSKSQRGGLLALIEKLGEWARSEIHGREFKSQPRAVFVIDPNTEDDLLDAVGLAVNYGALVFVPDNEAIAMMGSGRSKSVRLSHTLAWTYWLPLTMMHPVEMSVVLNSEKARNTEYKQRMLFSKRGGS